MSKNNPTALDVVPVIVQFKQWLTGRGAELLSITNEWELVRFKTGKGLSIVYRSKHDNIPCSFVGADALKAWKEFCNPDSRWRAIPAAKRERPVSTEYRTIRNRDGILCFFCAEVVPEGEGTLEHLIAVTHGGPNHISNKFLAHKQCNKKAGCLSAPEKILIYHQSRLKKAVRNINDRREQDRLASVGNSS